MFSVFWSFVLCRSALLNVGFGRSQPKALRSCVFQEQGLPVKLQAKKLGVDIACSLKQAAACRSQRAKKVLGRLTRLGSLPCPFWRKTRLLLSSVYLRALRGAETGLVPKTVLRKLRAQPPRQSLVLIRVPHLGLLGSYKCDDPQFVLLLNRLRLFRQLLKELPQQAPFFLSQLQITGMYKGPAAWLVQVLGISGWEHHPDGVFVDNHGRTFHVVLTPFRHIELLLLTSWGQEVARRVARRRYLGRA